MSIVHNKSRRQLTTPAGYAKYPHLNTPDTKFDENGVYKVDLALDADSEAAADLVEVIDTYLDEAVAEKQDELKPAAFKKATRYKPYIEEEDEEGEPTGRLLFRMKSNAKVKDKKTGKQVSRSLAIFDAGGGSPLKNPPIIRNGSTIKASVKVGSAWHNPTAGQIGVSLYISAIQILELSEGGASASLFGFGDESDDYSAVITEASEDEGFTSEESGYTASDDGDDAEDEGDF